MTTSVELRRTKMAQFYSKLRESFRSRLKQSMGITNISADEQTTQNDNQPNIWMLSTAILSANGSQVSINNINDPTTPTYPNLRFKYLHVQSYASSMNLNQLNLNIQIEEANENTTEKTTESNDAKPFDLVTNLIDSNQANLVSLSKQHIHTWFAVNPYYKFSVPLVTFNYITIKKSDL